MDRLTQPWTQEEDDTIRQLGPKISLQRLAIRIKRSETSVKARARALDVKTCAPPRLSLEERRRWS
jgi:hypothetical protein